MKDLLSIIALVLFFACFAATVYAVATYPPSEVSTPLRAPK